MISNLPVGKDRKPGRRTFIVASVSGLVGMAIGGIAIAWFVTSYFRYGIMMGSVANLSVEGAVLEKLHAGDIDGAKLTLDSHLDGELLTIGYAIEDGLTLPARGASAIARIKRVRELTGYTSSDPTIQGRVDAVLALGILSE